MVNQQGSIASLIRVAVVEDQTPTREALTILLNGTEGLRCVGAFGSMEDTIAALEQSIPDILLVDIGLPRMSGIEGIRLLKRRYPGLLCLMLTVYEDDDRIFDALCAGACGYLLKKTPPAKLLESLKEVMNGGAPMSPEIARRVIELFRTSHSADDVDYHLTPYETRLLKMLIEGHNYRSAAAQLGLSVNTISFHMRSIYDKLEVHSKSQAVSKALRQHIIR
ncbi:response regulator transcription factor [bacterium]|nr:response regulator transcription factor [bacterium]